MDVDGRKIVDVTGNILYQDGQWTEAAKGSDAMVLGNAMMKTNIGTKVWNKMIQSSTLITMRISNDLKRSARGGLVLGEAHTKSKNNERVVHIVVYKESLNEYTKPNKKYKDSEKQEMYKNSTEEEQLGAVAIHEGTHSVDELFDDNREQRAVINEKTYLREIELSKPILIEKLGKNLFNINQIDQ